MRKSVSAKTSAFSWLAIAVSGTLGFVAERARAAQSPTLRSEMSRCRAAPGRSLWTTSRTSTASRSGWVPAGKRHREHYRRLDGRDPPDPGFSDRRGGTGESKRGRAELGLDRGMAWSTSAIAVIRRSARSTR